MFHHRQITAGSFGDGMALALQKLGVPPPLIVQKDKAFPNDLVESQRSSSVSQLGSRHCALLAGLSKCGLVAVAKDRLAAAGLQGMASAAHMLDLPEVSATWARALELAADELQKKQAMEEKRKKPDVPRCSRCVWEARQGYTLW